MPVGSYALLKIKAPPAVDSRRFLNFISETTVKDANLKISVPRPNPVELSSAISDKMI
jgi:hypothetical protein